MKNTDVLTACLKYFEGRGSFEDALKAIDDYAKQPSAHRHTCGCGAEGIYQLQNGGWLCYSCFSQMETML